MFEEGAQEGTIQVMCVFVFRSKESPSKGRVRAYVRRVFYCQGVHRSWEGLPYVGRGPKKRTGFYCQGVHRGWEGLCVCEDLVPLGDVWAPSKDCTVRAQALQEWDSVWAQTLKGKMAQSVPA